MTEIGKMQKRADLLFILELNGLVIEEVWIFVQIVDTLTLYGATISNCENFLSVRLGFTFLFSFFGYFMTCRYNFLKTLQMSSNLQIQIIK